VPGKDIEKRFLAAISDSLVTLPHDLKILYEAASEENLDRAARELAVGAIIYVLSLKGVPGVPRGDFLNYCGVAIVIPATLQRIAEKGGEYADAFKERFGDFYDGLDERLRLYKEALGPVYDSLIKLVDGLTSLEHKGKKLQTYLDDDEASEYLYEDGLEFGTEYDVDESMLSDRLKRASTVFEVLEKLTRVKRRA